MLPRRKEEGGEELPKGRICEAMIPPRPYTHDTLVMLFLCHKAMHREGQRKRIGVFCENSMCPVHSPSFDQPTRRDSADL